MFNNKKSKIKMKSISNLKLKDITAHKLNIPAMGKLLGGVNEGIQLLDYGCTNYVCTDDKKNSSYECTAAKCKSVSCSSGA